MRLRHQGEQNFEITNEAWQKKQLGQEMLRIGDDAIRKMPNQHAKENFATLV